MKFRLSDLGTLKLPTKFTVTIVSYHPRMAPALRRIALGLGAAAIASIGVPAQTRPPAVTARALRAAPAADWLSYGRDHAETLMFQHSFNICFAAIDNELQAAVMQMELVEKVRFQHSEKGPKFDEC